MKYRNILALTILSISVLMFSGCGKNNSTTEPVISDAVEETKPIEEENDTEEIEESEDTASEAIDTEENDSSENSSNNGVAGTGYDSKTDEEIEAELEEMESTPKEISQEEDIAQATDENGNFDPRKLTNGGKGYDLGEVHYETRGEYLDALAEQDANDPNTMTEEEWDEFLEKMQ